LLGSILFFTAVWYSHKLNSTGNIAIGHKMAVSVRVTVGLLQDDGTNKIKEGVVVVCHGCLNLIDCSVVPELEINCCAV